MMKKFLSSLLLGAFVFGLGAVDIQIANAASPFKKLAYSQYKPKPPQKNKSNGEQNRQRYGGKTQKK
ncbi:MAG: hypothetical protein IKP64_01370 [Selenomonadaceae bacterium]|nr:hypothetical protein [Selenomonadaceae bacterium]MBR4382184.1 hypothetical protein [Selenomonadaceae bacterium]